MFWALLVRAFSALLKIDCLAWLNRGICVVLGANRGFSGLSAREVKPVFVS